MVLKNVHESEEDVQNMLIEVSTILKNNFPGPETYITYYKKYSYLSNGTETNALNTFFESDPFPLLNVRIILLNTHYNKVLISMHSIFFRNLMIG